MYVVFVGLPLGCDCVGFSEIEIVIVMCLPLLRCLDFAVFCACLWRQSGSSSVSRRMPARNLLQKQG